MAVLDKVNNPKDLKKLSIKEKNILAKEIREKIIDVVSKNGGHLASNLGAVELTIAIHSCFNAPLDKIIWDVGHQSYTHKILTDRKEKFPTLRKMGGIAGFPRTDESIYDTFDTGHSSTSISVALGMARARDILKQEYNVVAVIGDGALTGGMALEALNDAGISNTNITVILNDNEMSISKNTGGMSLFLSKLRSRKWYVKINSFIKRIISKIPLIGKIIIKIVTRIKSGIKSLIIPKMYFENIKFTYIGPIDGHDIGALESAFKMVENIKRPKLIHVITKKGKGYMPAEENPNLYHSIGKFDIKTGLPIQKKKKDYSCVMGEHLVKLARQNKKIVAITAAMEEGTGLSAFAKRFPDRFFDVEIAEQHALTMAAGMAKVGLVPVIPIYSSFLQRGYDQLVHDIAIQDLGVVICVDRAGIVGADGETHQGLLDLSYLSTIPNMNVLAPKNYKELELMLEFAIKLGKPVAIRYPRGEESSTIFKKERKIVHGKSEIIQKGDDLTIVAVGNMVAKAMDVANILKNHGISIEIINARFVKPIDLKTIESSLNKTKKLVTIEDNNTYLGFGKQLNYLVGNNNYINFGYPDEFIKHGTVNEIEKKYKIDTDSIVKIIKERFFE